MSVFDRIDYLQSKHPEPTKEAVKQLPMPKLSFAEIDAVQQEQQQVVRKKPGPKPKLSEK